MSTNPIRDFVFSMVRTIIPHVVTGAIVWLGSNFEIVIDDNTKAQATVIAYGVAFAIYYFLARMFETYVSPKFSFLVGDFRKGKTVPVYADPTKTTVLAPTGETE